jgi:hypothetical protein
MFFSEYCIASLGVLFFLSFLFEIKNSIEMCVDNNNDSYNNIELE